MALFLLGGRIWVYYVHFNDETNWGDGSKTSIDAIQPSKDLLEVLVGPVTRFTVKKFKEVFNGLLQDTWSKVDFKSICNNKE